MAGLHHRLVMVQTGKPRLSRRYAAPPACCGAHRKTASLSAVRCATGMLWCTLENHVCVGDIEQPVCLCEVQTANPARRFLLHSDVPASFQTNVWCQRIGVLKQ